jgi:hypothetical protein
MLKQGKKQLTFYNVVAVSAFLYGSESWTIKARDLNGIQSVEMRFVRTVKGCARLDHIKSEDIRNELKL